jgi:branched-chain amino acid transport system substrate-binding protein
MRSRRGLLRLLALLFAFSLVAAACGDSDDDGAETTTDDTSEEATEDTADDDSASDGGGTVDDDEAAAAFDDEATTTEAMDDAPAAAETIEDLQAEWAASRQVTIDMLTAGIDAGDFGIGDDNVLRGPSGFEIDLSTCPEDWSNTGGITDTEIRLGQSFVRSGTLAAYINLSIGMEMWYKQTTLTGGVDGKDLVFITKDDGYVAAQTIEFVDELIEAENVFFIHTGGSPNTLATYDKINDECIPQPLVATGHPAWGDPVNHPWTTGSQLSYSTEAILWGNWIKANLADELPVKVAGLVMDNDFGLAYEEGMATWAEDNPDVISEFVPVRHDPAAPTLTNEVTTIAASDPDVFISMTAGNPCLLAIQEVEKAGLLETLSAAFTPSVCKGIEAFMVPAGEASDNWWIVGGGQKDISDPKYGDDVFISWLNDFFRSEGLDPSISLLGSGIFYAFGQVEGLKIAAELPGGLTRTNYMLALRSLSVKHPMLLEGITFATDGTNDSYYVEGSDISQFDFANKTWIQVGNLVDLNGSSPNCSWDKDNGGCK